MLLLSDIRIYPIKATRALPVREAVVERRGLEHDRRWMLVDASGTFLTQREHPRLALVDVQVRPDGLEIGGAGQEALRVPFPGEEAPRLAVRVWKDQVEAVAAPDDAGAWFTRLLGTACRLVFMPPSARRPVDPAYGGDDDVVSFADGYPLLLTSEASLAALNDRLAQPLPMDRFRPNVVVTAREPFEEDRWERIRIGEVAFRVAKPCARCAVTTVDQRTGEAGVEPLRALASFRRRDGKVFFGQNLIPEQEGTIRVGAVVKVLG